MSILSQEPVFFKNSINVSFSNQVSKCSSVSVKVPKNFNINKISFLNANILNERIYVSMSTSMDRIIDTIRFLLKEGEKEIVLKDDPLGVINYRQYEGNVINILEQINNIPFTNISLEVDTYLNDVLKNINNYSTKLRCIYVNVYGICVDLDKSMNSLLNYSINTTILSNQTNLLNKSQVELIIQPNTICQRINGVSNTFGSVLWLLDLMFQLSFGRVNKICLDGNDFNVVYAHMLYSFVSKNANIFKVDILPKSSLNVSVYYTRNTEYHNFIVIHKDVNEDNIQVNVRLESKNKGKVYRLLSNQTVTGENGISFGNISFDSVPVSITKRYSGKTQENYSFIVGKFSAVVFQIPLEQRINMDGGAYFEYDKDNTIVSIQPKTEIGDVDAVPTTMTLKQFEKNFQSNL